MQIYLSRFHLDAEISLADYITDRVGSCWVVCRATKRNRERYVEQPLISPSQYARYKMAWQEARDAARKFLGYDRT